MNAKTCFEQTSEESWFGNSAWIPYINWPYSRLHSCPHFQLCWWREVLITGRFGRGTQAQDFFHCKPSFRSSGSHCQVICWHSFQQLVFDRESGLCCWNHLPPPLLWGWGRRPSHRWIQFICTGKVICSYYWIVSSFSCLLYQLEISQEDFLWDFQECSFTARTKLPWEDFMATEFWSCYDQGVQRC